MVLGGFVIVLCSAVRMCVHARTTKYPGRFFAFFVVAEGGGGELCRRLVLARGCSAVDIGLM